MEALLQFYNKFPEFLVNDLYVTGESYAGIYVPYLVWKIDAYNQIDDRNFTINLKGFIVGNAVTNWKWDGDPALIDMAYSHGIYGSELQQLMNDNHCNFEYIDVDVSGLSAICEALSEKFFKLIEYINYYDVYRPCYDCPNTF